MNYFYMKKKNNNKNRLKGVSLFSSAGFTDWSGCELNPEYCEIAKARIKHWTGEDVEMETTYTIPKETDKIPNTMSSDYCECGGKIKKIVSGRCCDLCMKDY
jgi:hypothetical protein